MFVPQEFTYVPTLRKPSMGLRKMQMSEPGTEIRESETIILSERALNETSDNLDVLLDSLLQAKRVFEQSLPHKPLTDEDALASAAFNLMQSCCRITGADGASLYSSKRAGYLDRRAFCADPNLAPEQIRSASQASEHVAVGRGISGYLALDATTRERLDYDLKYPIKENARIAIWDIRAVYDLPQELRFRTSQLQSNGAIHIASMFLVKEIGKDGTDYILQLVRKAENGLFSEQEKQFAELFAGLMIPHFRDLEPQRQRPEVVSPLPDASNQTSVDLHTPIQQIAASAYQSIQAIATAAMEKIQRSS